ncbi:uncharacterized protein [Haliotis asinina]|uniref:uncharacterized protein isoform X1 n=1 Tax=Haliotis asinina TaxID=109174 RepID=UPI003531F3FA
MKTLLVLAFPVVMAAASVCRKRPRSDLEEDCDDCLPISKRINKLHIESARRSQGEGLVERDASQGFTGEGTSSANCDPHLLPWQQAQLVSPSLVCGPGANQNQLSIPGCSVASHQTQSSLNPEEAITNNNDILNSSDNVAAGCDQCPINMADIAGYDPELKEGENPHYFRVNNILYDAHVSRVTRTKSFHELNS